MKLLSRNLSLLITAVILLIFVAYFIDNAHKFEPLLHIRFVLLLIIAAADILSIGISGVFTKFILEPFNKYIPLKESFYISLLSSVGNFFAPAGAGFGFRAVYLKRKYSFPYSEYLSTLSGNYILVFLVNSFFGLLSLYLLRAKANGQFGVLAAIFLAIFIVSLLLTIIKVPLKEAKEAGADRAGQIRRILYRITHGWNFIASHKPLLGKLIGLTFFNLLLTMIIAWAIFHSLHFSVGFAPLLLFSVLGSLSLFINITPANLGVKEAIYLFSSAVLGLSAPQVLSVALVDRGVLFLVLAFCWMGFGRKVFTKTKAMHSTGKSGTISH